MSFGSSYDNIYQWLERCNELRELDFDLAAKINDTIDTAYLPISFDNPAKEPRTLDWKQRLIWYHQSLVFANLQTNDGIDLGFLW